MDELIVFLWKSMVVSGVLCAWYMLALKNKRLHNYNRFFLLFTLYASIQVPLLNIQWSQVQVKPLTIFTTPEMLLHSLDAAGTVNQAAQRISDHNIDWQGIIVAVIALISICLLIVMMARIVWISRLGKRYPRTVRDGVVMVHTDLRKAPFSFMNIVYWRKDLSPDTGSGRLILQHELVHVKQKHSYDKIASQLLTCIFWMNPFYWIIQKELGMVHEFIADEKAIINSNEGIQEDEYTEAFSRMLLQAHDSTSYFAPEHQFFASPIKRRLIMLQTNRKVRASVLRRGIVLPLIAGSILVFGMRPGAVPESPVVRSVSKIILVVDPGHGGDDNGGRVGSLTEKELTLRLAERIKKLAPAYNVEVHLTRNTDKFVSLQERAAFSNNLHPDYFICLHVDNMQGEGSGKATFDIAINNKNAKVEESSQLAFALFKRISRPEWEQRNAPSEKGAYVLKENLSPAVLIEMGDIRNAEQMQHFQDDAKLDALSKRILEGVVEAYQQ